MGAHSSWSRRRFVATSAGALGSGWLAAHWPDIARAARHAHAAAAIPDASPDRLEHLSAVDARDVAALAAQIIPTTATAGAREAGVVYFIDRALGTFHAGHAEEFAVGIGQFAQVVRARHGASTRFADLPADLQLDLAQAAAGTPFFEAMRTLTILGFLASPAYGGNRGGVGWKAVGFTDEHAFKPPFGHYDRDYAGFEPYPRSAQSESEGAPA